MIIFPYFSRLLINPYNLSMTSHDNINGEFEIFFSKNVSLNVPYFMFISGFISMIVMILPILFINEPNSIKSHLW